MIGDYPTQLDEIDQWLNDNFGILPGACSSTENLHYSVARRVAEVLWPNNQSLSDANKRLEEIARKGLENAHTVDFSKQYENSMKILQKAKINLPSDDDLEKYASRAGFDYVDDIEQKYPGHRWNDHDVEFAYRDGIIAGAEWQKRKENECMEENHICCMKFDDIEDARHAAYDQGRDDMKQQMMKDAIEGIIMSHYGEEHSVIKFYNKIGSQTLKEVVVIPLQGEIGDKVKIIIVKEEE